MVVVGGGWWWWLVVVVGSGWWLVVGCLCDACRASTRSTMGLDKVVRLQCMVANYSSRWVANH